ncbi:MAG TPA: DUF488 family protein [Thermoplasmata archaeon]|jgi:uncharacterized protein YeaO (DUF488 family)
MTVQTKRVYEPLAVTDGKRYLIDRLWPRGLRKESLHPTEWMKEIAPSAGLRTWFQHEPEKYAVFRERYRAELESHSDLLDRIASEARSGTVTLLFAARDPDHCNATVLQELLAERSHR